MAHTKEYIKLKISNCQGLVDNAISEDEAKVYQDYLAFWEEKLPKKERPEEIARKEEIKREKEEAVEYAKREAEIRAEKVANIKAMEAKEAAEKKALIDAKKAELAELQGFNDETMGDAWKKVDKILDALPEDKLEFVDAEDVKITLVRQEDAEDFEIKYPGKKAYRYQNGDKFKTIAFKQYLNQRTQ